MKPHILKSGWNITFLLVWIEFISLVQTMIIQALRNFFKNSRFKSRVEINHYHEFNKGWQIACYNQFYPLIKEDWVLVLDIDEFLFLNQHPNIQSYLESFKDTVGQVQFPWLNCISNQYYSERVLDPKSYANNHVFNHVKSMVKRDCVNGLGVHRHVLVNGENVISNGEIAEQKSFHDRFFMGSSYFNDYPCILHFCTRGFFDTIIRISIISFITQKGAPMNPKIY